MDIQSPRLLKLKAALFLVITAVSLGLIFLHVFPLLDLKLILLQLLLIWSACRAYYFCFYVLEHYADPTFRYAGIWDLLMCLTGLRKKAASQKK